MIGSNQQFLTFIIIIGIAIFFSYLQDSNGLTSYLVATQDDNDLDGYMGIDSGGDDCNDNDANTNPGAKEICTDEKDNDCDGFTDGKDSDCPEPTPKVEDCGDRIDNDGDGYTDCRDRDCRSNQACLPDENCYNGKDDDGDKKIDCADENCERKPLCIEKKQQPKPPALPSQKPPQLQKPPKKPLTESEILTILKSLERILPEIEEVLGRLDVLGKKTIIFDPLVLNELRVNELRLKETKDKTILIIGTIKSGAYDKNKLGLKINELKNELLVAVEKTEKILSSI